MDGINRWRQRSFAAAGIVAFVATTSPGSVAIARSNRWASVEAALSRIPTVTGQSVLARTRACGIRIDRRRSQLSRIPGGYNLYAPVTVPNGPGDDYRMIAIGWTLKGGEATPTSVWAQKLQEKPAPLGYNGQLQC